MSLQRKLARTFGSGVFVRIEETEKCVGYYGFGSGFEIGRHGGAQKGRLPKNIKMIRVKGRVCLPPGSPSYCEICPKREDCWLKHRKRVARLFPNGVKDWERRCAEDEANKVAGHLTVQKWQKEFGYPPPYFLVGHGNVVDAQLIAEGKAPEDRGEATLNYPFGILVVQ